MTHDPVFLSIFTPSRTRPEDLEAILVQRHALLEDSVERLLESAQSGNKHHLLFVGPRGTGKTHLMTLLVHRITQADQQTNRMRIAWLNEDETSTTFFDLLQRIYRALTQRYANEFPDTHLEALYELSQKKAEYALGQRILTQLQDRTLVVLIENLDALFEELQANGQKKLRAFIQEHPVLCLVATAQRLVDDIRRRKKAFFGFFQTEQLAVLSIDDATQLLSKIADLNQNSDLTQFLNTPTGISRVQALHHLSGGNHRIYIVLAQFITKDSIDALVQPFEKMVDEMTPYYQERIRWLPAQQRKITEYLCGQRPTAVKQIAKRLFASEQSISSQLKNLRDKGYVQSTKRGRESLYEISEPLMRMCVQVKETQSHAPLGILVDFIRIWYDKHELSQRLTICKTTGIERSYLESALAKNQSEGNLRARLVAGYFCADLDDQGQNWHTLIETYASQSDELGQACGLWIKGEDQQALLMLNDITQNQAHSDTTKAAAWSLATGIHHDKHSHPEAIQCVDSMLKFPNLPVHEIALALIVRGTNLYYLTDLNKAENNFKAIFDLQPTFKQPYAYSYFFLANIYLATGRWDHALTALNNSFQAKNQHDQQIPLNLTHLIHTLFQNHVTPKILNQRIQAFIQIFQAHDTVSELGLALICHIGALYTGDEPLPTAESLTLWASTWQQAGQNITAFSVPLRIFLTGIEFLKTKDRGVLLNLNQEERRILEQTMQLT